MKRFGLLMVCLGMSISCGGTTVAPSEPVVQEKPSSMNANDMNTKFTEFTNKFLMEYFAYWPVEGTNAGAHEFDGKWPDLSIAGEARWREQLQKWQTELTQFSREVLDVQNQVDFDLLQSQIQYRLFEPELHDAERSPSLYTGLMGDGLDPLVSRDFGTPESRAKSLIDRLKGIAHVVNAAKERLREPSKPHTETAIRQNDGLIGLCEGEIERVVAQLSNASLKEQLRAASKEAASVLREFKTTLTSHYLPKSTDHFRTGSDLFKRKLQFVLDDNVEPSNIVKGARDLLAKTQLEMVDTAKEIWAAEQKPIPTLETISQKKDFLKKALAEIAKDRPTNATIVAEATTLLQKATDFVREHNLVTLPDEPCKVIEMPEYRRGVAIAYCDSSGPLEENPQTFYAISPTPKDWSAERAESFYKEYNRSMLADLTIHEAMPGHYLQLMHNNKFKSPLRAWFASGPFVEGWAVYTEWLMAKYGFGGPKVRLMRQKMILRLSVNAILDHEVHAGTMDEKSALHLMMEEAFQEEGEAIGKWRRAQLTSAQLTTYYYGFTEMMKLRQKYESQAGFSEKSYHDKLLSFGSPSMRQIRILMEK